MKHLVISPHADDAVWSCGGILAEWAAAGRSITVITVFDADEADGADTVALTPIAVRRAEDIAALAALPADRVGLDFREAALRTAPDGKPRYPSLLALRRAPHPSDEALVPAIARAIAPYAVAADVVHAPLGERTHVDHALARQAADLVVEPWRLRYYGEFRYAPITWSASGRGCGLGWCTGRRWTPCSPVSCRSRGRCAGTPVTSARHVGRSGEWWNDTHTQRVRS
jgi:LmbE family N-acetylglucosaminyl deacetylase